MSVAAFMLLRSVRAGGRRFARYPSRTHIDATPGTWLLAGDLCLSLLS